MYVTLLGESAPLTKTALPQLEDSTIYVPSKFKSHTLFGGTEVIQTRFYANSRVLAVVVTIGLPLLHFGKCVCACIYCYLVLLHHLTSPDPAFATARGRMVRSIMYPKPLDLKFYADSIKFLCALACVGKYMDARGCPSIMM